MRSKVAIILSIIVLGGYLISIALRKSDEANPKNFLHNVKDQNRKVFEGMNEKQLREDLLYRELKQSISRDDSSKANALIDTLIKWHQRHLAHIFRGMLFEKESKFDSAINEYSEAMEEVPFSKGLSMRAKLYFKLQRFKLALADYQKSYLENYDFSYDLGKTFESLGYKDSALKYYKIYLDYYPNNDSVIKRIAFLQHNSPPSIK